MTSDELPSCSDCGARPVFASGFCVKCARARTCDDCGRDMDEHNRRDGDECPVEAKPVARPKVGDRVRLGVPADRVALADPLPAGRLGTVVSDDAGILDVKLDVRVPDLDEWENRLQFAYGERLGAVDADELARVEILAIDEIVSAHAARGGDLCTDEDQDLCCDLCGVSLGAPCDLCSGVGYHREGCAEFEE